MRNLLKAALVAVVVWMLVPSIASAKRADCQARCEWHYTMCKEIAECPGPSCNETWLAVCDDEWWDCYDGCNNDCPWYCGFYCCWISPGPVETEETCDVGNPPAQCWMDTCPNNPTPGQLEDCDEMIDWVNPE